MDRPGRSESIKENESMLHVLTFSIKGRPYVDKLFPRSALCMEKLFLLLKISPYKVFVSFSSLLFAILQKYCTNFGSVANK